MNIIDLPNNLRHLECEQGSITWFILPPGEVAIIVSLFVNPEFRLKGWSKKLYFNMHLDLPKSVHTVMGIGYAEEILGGSVEIINCTKNVGTNTVILKDFYSGKLSNAAISYRRFIKILIVGNENMEEHVKPLEKDIWIYSLCNSEEANSLIANNHAVLLYTKNMSETQIKSIKDKCDQLSVPIILFDENSTFLSDFCKKLFDLYFDSKS